MNELKELLLWAKNFLNKHKRSLLTIFVPIVGSIFICTNYYGQISIPVKIYKAKFSIDVAIIISIVLFVAWLIYYLVNKSSLKNKTNLPGIGIFIEESFVDSTDKNRNIFLTKLKRELSKEYKTTIFEKSDFKKYKKGEILDHKIFKDYNISFAILIIEESGNKKGKQVYQISSQNIGFYSEEILVDDFDLDCMQENIQIEINNAFRTKYVIRLDNNISETDRFVKEFHLALNYITGISYMFTRNPEKSLKYFYEIKNIKNSIDIKSSQVSYIMSFLEQRIFESKYFELMVDYKYNNNYSYISASGLLERINNLLSDTNKIKFQDELTRNLYHNNINLYKIMILFDLEEYDKALKLITDENLENEYPGECFFLKVCCMFGNDSIDNRDALRYFKKNKFKFKREKDFFIAFVLNRYELKNDNQLIRFLYMISNRYYGDRLLAEEIKEEIINENEKYIDILKKS